MLDEELRILHREETFTDVAVRELAKSNARCCLALDYGRCKKSQCKSCAKHKRLISCYKQMSEYDRERLHNYTGDYYAIYNDFGSQLSNFGFVFWLLGALALASIGLLAFYIGAVSLADAMGSISHPQETYDCSAVKYTNDIPWQFRCLLQDTHDEFPEYYYFNYQNDDRTFTGIYDRYYDLNNDGTISCVDRALWFINSFNYINDTRYADVPGSYRIGIMRIYNYGDGTNHVIPVLTITDPVYCVVYIEPQNIYGYLFTEDISMYRKEQIHDYDGWIY